MSQLTDKYGDVYHLAHNLGVQNLNSQEENGRMTISGTAPNRYAADQIWEKVKQIDPDLGDNDLTLNIDVTDQTWYGEYEVQSGDTLSAIAQKLTKGQVSYQKIFEANRDTLSDPDQIQPGQKLKIPNF